MRRGNAAAGQTVNAEHYIADGPVVGETKLESCRPAFVVNMPSADYEMKIRFWDGTPGRCAVVGPQARGHCADGVEDPAGAFVFGIA